MKRLQQLAVLLLLFLLARSSEVEKIPHEVLFKSLVEEGSRIQVFCNHSLLPEEIPWINYTLIEKGQEFFRKHFAVGLFSLMVTNTVGCMSKQVAATLWRHYYPENNCGPRFLSTFHTAINQWLLTDFRSGPNRSGNSTFMKAIQRVCYLHGKYARLSENGTTPLPKIPPENPNYPESYSDLVKVLHNLTPVDNATFLREHFSWRPPMFFTQLDVASVQLGGIAPFLTFPELAGVYHTKGLEEDEGLKGLVHMWAVIGKMLGLDDRFNPALHASKELTLKVAKKLGLPAFKAADESVIHCMRQMVEGVFYPNVFWAFPFTERSLIYTSLEPLGVDLHELWKSMGYIDKGAYYSGQTLTFLLRFDAVRVIVNFIQRGLLNTFIVLFYEETE